VHGLLAGALLVAAPGERGPVYPGVAWEVRAPTQVGLSAAGLDAFAQYVGGRGCVTRHGYMIYSWGDATLRGDAASAAKPWFGHFLLKAVEEGRIGSLDDPVARFEPRLNGLNAGLGFKDRGITWRCMASQTSSYGVREAPGTAFDYNDWQMALFFDTLFLQVYRSTWERVDEEVLHPRLTDLLQCEDNPTFMAFGTGDRPGRLAVSPRDFARFGLLYLRRGAWRGKQLLDEQHALEAVTRPLPNTIPRTAGEAAEMIAGQRSMGSLNIPDNQTDHLGSYSFLWWTNGIDREGGRHWPDAPQDAYGAFGHGGLRAMVVMPSLDIVMSWNDAGIDSRERENEALRLLVAAVSPAEARPHHPAKGQIVVDPEHPQWLRRQGGGPFFMCGPGDPEGFLYRGSLRPDGTRSGDQLALIRRLARTGANCLYMIAVRSHGGDGDATQNPFVDHDPAKGVNARVLDQWETWFRELDPHGIVIFLILYDDSACVWHTGDDVGPVEQGFIRAIVGRFQHHRNLIWCVAEEYQEALSAARVRRIAAEIRAADGNRHPIAVHKLSGLDFSEFADDPNIDQFAIQYNVPTAQALHEGVVEAWRRAGGRRNLTLAEAADWGAGAPARRKSWACAMGGAYVMILGMDVAGTPLAGLQDCGRLVRFMESTNLSAMAPHDELAYGGTRYVLACPGRAYIAYTSEPTRSIGLRAMTPGIYGFRWFDCASGRSVTQGRVAVSGGDQLWTKPAEIGDEFAVFIERH